MIPCSLAASLLAVRSVDGVVHLDFDPHRGLRERPQLPEFAAGQSR